MNGLAKTAGTLSGLLTAAAIAWAFEPTHSAIAQGFGIDPVARGLANAAKRGPISNPSAITQVGNSSFGTEIIGGAKFTASPGGTAQMSANWNSGIFEVASTGTIGFSSTTGAATGSLDVKLVRDAANTLALRNGTNAQLFNAYNSYTDSSNYERARIGWVGGDLKVGTESAGTGATTKQLHLEGYGQIRFYTGSTLTQRWTVGAGGDFTPATNVTYSIGSTSLAPLDVFVGRHLGTPATGGTAPTISSCGTSPTTSTGSNDTAGEVTTGSTATTSCTITFATAYTNAPSCVVVDRSALANLTSYTVSTTAIVLTYASSTSAKMVYHCIGA